MKKSANPILLAMSALQCNQSELAEKFGVTPAVVYTWKVRGAIPAKALRKACEVTGLPPHLLNPNIPVFIAGGVAEPKEESHD